MKRFLSALCVFCFVLGGCNFGADLEPRSESLPAPSAVVGSAAKNVGNEDFEAAESFLYGRSFLDGEALVVYDRLLAKAGSDNPTGDIPLPESLGEAEVWQLGQYFFYDNPVYYWLELSTVTEEATGSRWLRVSMVEGITADDVLSRQQEIDDLVAEVMALPVADDFAYIVAAHDWMIRRIQYDKGSENADSENLYGAMVNRYAVCDGFAKTFQYLMALRGIDCVYYSGTSSRGVSHAWNAVRIDGDWYYVDVTWDNITPTGHFYLGLTLEEISREREFLAEQYPEILPADNTAYNYYRRMGYGVEPVAGEEVTRMATAFVNELERLTPHEEEARWPLEIKVLGTPDEYEQVKAVFVREPFLVLNKMKTMMRERNIPISLHTEGTVRYSFNDAQQILILSPLIKKK